MPTVTLAQLQSDILDRLEGNATLYPAADVTAAINEAYRIVNAFCALNQSTVSVPGFSVANQLVYQIPSPILFPLVAYCEGVMLEKVSLGALARTFRGWATDTTAKLGPVQRWAPVGITQFVIHPMDSLGGRDLQVTGVIEPTLLAAASDPIQVEDVFLTMLVEYGAHRLQLREGGKTFADSSLLLQTFYRKLKDRMALTSMRFPRYFVAAGPAQ